MSKRTVVVDSDGLLWRVIVLACFAGCDSCSNCRQNAKSLYCPPVAGAAR